MGADLLFDQLRDARREHVFEVLGGVKEGEQIVAGPYQAIRDLKDGAPVRAMKAPADSARRAAT